MADTTAAAEREVFFGGDSRVGREHPENEDVIWTPQNIPPQLLTQKGYLFILADGVGGYQGGRLASQTAVETLQRSYYANSAEDIETSLRMAVEAANTAVCQQAQATGYTDMGSTVVAAVMYQHRLVVANVGDSRAYVWRKGKGLRQLSTDHTWVAERLAEGLINEEEAAHHQLRHVITRSLGQHPVVEPAVRTLALRPEDRVLLCCDGIWEVLPKEVLRNCMGRNLPPQRIAQMLAKEALNTGGSDDVSAIVAIAPGPAASDANPWRAFLQIVGAFRAASPTAFLVASIAIGVLLVALLGLAVSAASRSLQDQITAMFYRTPAAVASQSAPAFAPTPTSSNVELPGGVGGATSETAMPIGTPQPIVTPTGTPPLAVTPTRTATPAVTPTWTPQPTDTPTGTATPAVTPTYCILPCENQSMKSHFPAQNVDLGTCKGEDGSIPVGATIEVQSAEVFRWAKCGQPVISVRYEQTDYLIFPYRIGQWVGATCTPLDDWRTYFSQPRME